MIYFIFQYTYEYLFSTRIKIYVIIFFGIYFGQDLRKSQLCVLSTRADLDISVYAQQKLRKYFRQRKCKLGVLILNLTIELNHLKMGLNHLIIRNFPGIF